MSLPVNRYEPNAEKKKTHNRRKSSTRSLHQKLVVKNILKIFLGKKQHKKSPPKACGEKIFRKYFWEKNSTRSLHQKLVMKKIFRRYFWKRAAHEVSTKSLWWKKIFRKYFWEKSSCLGEISSHINLPPLSHSSSKLFMDRHLDNVYIVDTLNSSLML